MLGLLCEEFTNHEPDELSTSRARFVVRAFVLAVHIGDFLRNGVLPLNEDVRSDFSVLSSATLTLLGVLVGFSFSIH